METEFIHGLEKGLQVGNEAGDIFGIKPFGEAANALVQAGINSASAFLSRICLPASEEFGLMLRDNVSAWRANNLVAIARKSKEKYESNDPKNHGTAHPRIVHAILENGSWTDDDTLQEMWGGILTASAFGDGKEDENLIFINILAQLTVAQAKVLNYSCKEAKKYISPGGWIMAEGLLVPLEKMQEIMEHTDIQRMDRELDHLVSLGLISHGFDPRSTVADITPRSLALHMYARCNACSMNPVNFYNLTIESKITDAVSIENKETNITGRAV